MKAMALSNQHHSKKRSHEKRIQQSQAGATTSRRTAPRHGPLLSKPGRRVSWLASLLSPALLVFAAASAPRSTLAHPGLGVTIVKLNAPPSALRSVLQGSSSGSNSTHHLSGHSSTPGNFARKDMFVGKCVGVLDGDSIYVEHDGQTERVDLWGIDCPELGQPYGLQAKQFTLSKVYGQTVRVRIKSHHKGRTLAFVDSGPGTTLNEELVGNGLAWYYPKQSDDAFLMPLLQDTARQDKRGLWAEKEPMTPWQWRKLH